MNSQQLANVLIKILGLSVFVHNIPSLVQALFAFSQAQGGAPLRLWVYPASSALMLVIGFYLIISSRSLAENLFKEGD